MQLMAVGFEFQLLIPSFGIVLNEMGESCDLDRALFPGGPCGSVMAVASRLWDPIRLDGHHRHDLQLRAVAKVLAKVCSIFADEIVLVTEYLSMKI